MAKHYKSVSTFIVIKLQYLRFIMTFELIMGLCMTWIHEVAHQGMIKEMRSLMKRPGINIDTMFRGRSPLVQAIASRQLKMVKVLVELGANIHLRQKDDDDEILPIHAGCLLGVDFKYKFAVTEFLINAGANVNARDAKGRTPLHYVAIRNSVDTYPLMNLLLENGANPRLKNRQGETPLQVALSWQHRHAKSFLEKVEVERSKSAFVTR